MAPPPLGAGGLYDHWAADIASTADYYPGGMMMPGRNSEYAWSRMGYNGEHKDDEIYGKGNFQDYGFRMLDNRLLKFWGVDPLTKKYPWYTPYQFAGNSPIAYMDLDGLEPRAGEVNYGKNVAIGLVHTASFNDPWILRNRYNLPQRENNNWLGFNLDLKPAAAIIADFARRGNRPNNVVFTTHADGPRAAFKCEPSVNTNQKDSYLFDQDLKNYNEGKKDQVPTAALEYINALENIFSNMNENGNFVLSACKINNVGETGAQLQKLAKGRINIYLSNDDVIVCNMIMPFSPELDRARIKDGKVPVAPSSNDFYNGFTKYPAGTSTDENGNTSYPQKEDISGNVYMQSQGEPLKVTTGNER